MNKKRDGQIEAGKIQVIRGSRATLAELRRFIEQMLRNRNVRYLFIDETMHLLRSKQFELVVDTLKSLADTHSTKLVLLGSNDLAELLTNYGQVARRCEIVHYRSYKTSANPIEKPGEAFIGAASLGASQKDFLEQVENFQAAWPCRDVPELTVLWPIFLDLSLGSIGLLKLALLRLAALQMRASGERFDPRMLRWCFKSKKQLKVILEEAKGIESKLSGACYGDSPLGSDDDIDKLYQRLKAA